MGKGPFNRGSCWVSARRPWSSINLICKCNSLQRKQSHQQTITQWTRRGPDIAINSSTELLSLVSGGVATKGASSEVVSQVSLLSSARYSGAKELDATRRVYNHPMFKQNLEREQLSVNLTRRQWRSHSLAQRSGQLPPCLCRPPEPRDECRPQDTRSHSQGATYCNMTHRDVLVSDIIAISGVRFLDRLIEVRSRTCTSR